MTTQQLVRSGIEEKKISGVTTISCQHNLHVDIPDALIQGFSVSPGILAVVRAVEIPAVGRDSRCHKGAWDSLIAVPIDVGGTLYKKSHI
jgi:hypothetical protein